MEKIIFQDIFRLFIHISSAFSHLLSHLTFYLYSYLNTEIGNNKKMFIFRSNSTSFAWNGSLNSKITFLANFRTFLVRFYLWKWETKESIKFPFLVKIQHKIKSRNRNFSILGAFLSLLFNYIFHVKCEKRNFFRRLCLKSYSELSFKQKKKSQKSFPLM